MTTSRGWLLDLYPMGNQIVLWFITDGGARWRLTDPFSPSFFVEGPELDTLRGLDEFRHTIAAVKGLEWIGLTKRLDFWTGKPRPVYEIRMTDMDGYRAAVHQIFRQYPGLTYYDCDIPPEVHYAYERGIFPAALCEIEAREDGRLHACRVLDGPLDTDYHAPPLREVHLHAEGCRMGRFPALDSLTLEIEGRSLSWENCAPAEMIRSLNSALRESDPDLIWTKGGDSMLFPVLFSLAARDRLPLSLDRESPIARRLVLDGRSYMSYGRVLYQAPDYPLFGRWHIDAENSFWSAETGLEGLLEVARLSKLPVQRAARRSIGTGISSIQLDYAYRQGYLIPWKKTQPEAWKSAATLFKADRGGLVYQPLTGVYEDAIELDFVSMYPSIMARENVSPETIGCGCCPPEPMVPELGYSICRRRKGMTSAVLAPIVEKRKLYKAQMKKMPDADRRAVLNDRQGAIKWLLVCCFGYLGYRNARFGRIEAHESTCAFSREKLLQAKEICEARGFDVLHAIVDCFWLRRKAPAADEEITTLCEEIQRATNLDIAIEGLYRWIVFLPSRRDPNLPVPNRYFGCFRDGKLKYRGIEIRRHDQAAYAQEIQGELLERLRDAPNLTAIYAMRGEFLAIVNDALGSLRDHAVPLEKLVLCRHTSLAAKDYQGNSMTAVAARQARRLGWPLHPGEAVRFIVLNAKDRDPDSRLRLVALLRPEDAYDALFYAEQVRRAAATILEPFFGPAILGAEPKKKRPRRKFSGIQAVQGELFRSLA